MKAMSTQAGILIVALLLSLGLGTTGQAASFDCSKATTKTEKAICSDPELSALDDMMALVWKHYKTKLDKTFPLKDGSLTENPIVVPKQALEQQREWLSKVDACAGKSDCIHNSYKSRILAISSSNFSVSGSLGSNYIRYYFERRDNGCEPSYSSVDAFYDEGLDLCYEVIPNMRSIKIFAASGVSIISYDELSSGYYHCERINLYVMDDVSESKLQKSWVQKYSYSYDENDISDGLRQEHQEGEIVNLSITLGDGFEFDNYFVGCGVRNLDVSGGGGFGGADRY